MEKEPVVGGTMKKLVSAISPLIPELGMVFASTFGYTEKLLRLMIGRPVDEFMALADEHSRAVLPDTRLFVSAVIMTPIMPPTMAINNGQRITQQLRK